MTVTMQRSERETFVPEEVDHDDRLILWMLERTPAQRLEALQNFVEGIATLRYARKISE